MSWSEVPNDSEFDLSKLQADQYLITYNSSSPLSKFSLYSRLEECVNCPFIFVKRLRTGIDTEYCKYQAIWKISDSSNATNVICTMKPDVAEFGVYNLRIEQNSCELETVVEPVNIYLSILSVIFIVLGIWIALYFFYFLFKKMLEKKNMQDADDISEKPKKRILSLDTFRGISITVMIFVNYGAGKYNFFEHAIWNGLNVADLVFPWFLWIMGVCIPISVKSALKRNESKLRIFAHIFRRSCILFLLGLLLNPSFIIQELRIFGVLQRFAFCYLIVATLNLIFTEKEEPRIQNEMLKDIILLAWQWLVILVVLVIHTAVTFGAEFEDCPKGYLGPGGLHELGQYLNCTGGITGYIDRKVLSEKHMLRLSSTTAGQIYQTLPFDPEGIFGILTSVVQVFIGVQAGVIIQTHKGHKGRMIRWLVWALVTGVIGGGLCEFSRDDGVIPINKNLWSVSYVMVTSCLAFIVLALCYWLIDMKSFWSGRPFIYAGMNAIIMYVGHSLTYNMFPFYWQVAYSETHFQALVKATWGTFSWLVVAYWLYTVEFFLSI